MTLNPTETLDFINRLEALKLVERTNRVLGGQRFENSAEHSWQAAMVALAPTMQVKDTASPNDIVPWQHSGQSSPQSSPTIDGKCL